MTPKVVIVPRLDPAIHDVCSLAGDYWMPDACAGHDKLNANVRTRSCPTKMF